MDIHPISRTRCSFPLNFTLVHLTTQTALVCALRSTRHEHATDRAAGVGTGGRGARGRPPARGAVSSRSSDTAA